MVNLDMVTDLLERPFKGPFAENRADLLLYEEHAFCPRNIFDIYYTPGLGTVTIRPVCHELYAKKILKKNLHSKSIFFYGIDLKFTKFSPNR